MIARAFATLAAWAVLCCAMPSAANAQTGGTAQKWRISGANELVVDTYSIDGDENASPFRFPGTFWTNRLVLAVDYDADTGRRLTFDVGILMGQNDYLADDGFVLETLRFELEDGTLALPYRIGAGDVFTLMSRRILETNVRGVSIDVQPQSSFDQSLLFIAGSGLPSWTDTFEGDGRELLFTGGSYYVGPRSGDAALVVNVLNSREVLPTSVSTGTLGGAPGDVERDQTIAGVFGAVTLAGVELEGEMAFLEGTAGEEDVSAGSYYAQAAHDLGRLSWRVRFEDNGRDYLPAGSTLIIANRRLGELYARYTLGYRGSLRGRVQLIEDRVSGPLSPQRTDLFGLSYDGRLLAARPTFTTRLSATINDRRTEDGLIDGRFSALAVDLRDRVLSGLSIGYRLDYRDTLDRVFAAGSRTSFDHTVSAGHRFGAMGGAFNLRGGLVYRNQTGAAGFRKWSPMIEGTGRFGAHAIGFYFTLLDQDFAIETTDDLRYHTRRLSYTYQRSRHRLSLELGQELRRPLLALETDSLRASFRYRYAFDYAR